MLVVGRVWPKRKHRLAMYTNQLQVRDIFSKALSVGDFVKIKTVRTAIIPLSVPRIQ